MNFVKINILTLFSKIICLVSGLFISIYIARVLGPAIKGTYYLLVQTVMILSVIALFGIDNAVIYFLGRKKYLREHIAILSNFMSLIFSLLTAVFFLGFYKFYSSYNALPELKPVYLFMIALALPFINILRLNSAILMGFNKFISYNLLNIALFLTMALSFILFIVLLKMGLFGALLSFLISYIVMSGVYLFMIFKSKEIRECAAQACEKIKISTLFNYGKKVFTVPILFLVLYRIDSFFLSHYSSMKEVGFYSVALSFAELLLFIPESVGTVLYPKLAYMSEKELAEKFLSTLKISMALTLAIASVIFVTIKYILPLLYGDIYAESIRLVYFLLFGMVMFSSYHLFSSYFQAAGRPSVIVAVLFISLVVKVILCFILVPPMNSIGAAIASVLSYLVCLLIFLRIFMMETKFRPKKIFVLGISDFNIIKKSFRTVFRIR